MTIQEQSAALERRVQLQKEINLHKITPIDRSIYTKTEQEKAKLYKLKTEWRLRVNGGYSINSVFMNAADTVELSAN